jgi:aminoglycoside phosphotransferase (APT) family kinase protein
VSGFGHCDDGTRGTLNRLMSHVPKQPAAQPDSLRGGGRFSVHILDGLEVVEKTGDPGALSREAAALRRIAGRGVGPALVSTEPGVLRTSLLDGGPRAVSATSVDDLGALGSLLRKTHETACQASGGLPGWLRTARTLASYRRRRAADALALAGPRRRALADRVIFGLPSQPAVDDPRPFRLLHGDLVAENIVWTSQGPRLVDWEFWRMGDPAEDLAYLAELNGLDDRAFRAVLDGYGVPGMSERADSWCALVALDAAAWYLSHGRHEMGEALVARAERLSGVRCGGG